MAEARGTRRGRWLVVAALMAGVLSALTVVLALAAPRRSIPSGASNLSQADALDSYVADVAVSPDGDRVAVVWVEDNEIAGAGDSVWLRWASESTGNGWSPRVPVFTGTAQTRDVRSAPVVVTGTRAYVVYVVEDSDLTRSDIFYVICHLIEDDSCDAAQTITSTFNLAPGKYFSGVDIALDDDENPYFAYRRVLHGTEETISTVYYYEGASQLEERVPGSGTEGAPSLDWSTTSGVPAIAWSDGFAHVVWEEQKTDGIEFEIRHNRRNIISGTWEYPSMILARLGTRTQHPRNPDVAAYKDHVVVTWDWQWTEEQAGKSKYALAYTHYLTGTNERWLDPYEVGTQGAADRLIDDEILRETLSYTYTSTADEFATPSRLYLQPSISLDREGLPTVVWHANNGTYGIMYSRAQSVTESAGDVIFSWSEPAVLFWPSTGESVSPAAAQAPVVSPTLHVAYLHKTDDDWETYYESREAGYIPGEHDNLAFLPIISRNWAGPE